MKQYTIINDKSFQQQLITGDHFGVNLVTTYDEEFVDPENELSDNVQQLGAQTLRFPGGSATENYFDMTEPDLGVSNRDPSETLTPMDEFFAQAGEIGVSVTIVIPTQMAFSTSAAQAMLNGSYGGRSDLDPQYLQDVQTFVNTAISYAETNGVEIKAFEIGNEFWGSGQMSAAEYGVVAGAVAQQLGDQLQDTPDVVAEVIVQTTSSASQLYSSRNDTEAYVGTVDGELKAFSQSDINAQFGGDVPEGFETVTVAGQGSARSQVAQIADGINDVPGAADAVDGIVQHYYESGGFAKADGSKSFKFSQFQRLEDQLARSDGADELSYHVTEWNTNASGAANNRGLQNASMMIETFFELVSNDVDVAQIWPLSFDAAQGISLVDLDGDDLSISGEMFAMMSESLVNLMPTLDWSTAGEIDIHGFSNEARDVLFVSERSGEQQEDVSLDASVFLSDQVYFMTNTQLWDGGEGGDNARAEPVITEANGIMSTSGTLSFDLDSWANTRIEITYVGESDDVVVGRGGADSIETFGGQDKVYGGNGDDTIDAGTGDDFVSSGAGDDLILDGSGNDTIDGGTGTDTASFAGSTGEFQILFDQALSESGDIRVLHADGDTDLLRNVEILQFEDETLTASQINAYLAEVYGSEVSEGGASAQVSLSEILAPPVEAPQARLEVGRTSIEQMNATYWQSVLFSEQIEDAAVIMGPGSWHGGQPFTVRVRNVTETGFEFQIDEWDYLDGYHVELEISWFAGTQGNHTLEDGSFMSLGSTTVDSVDKASVALENLNDQPMIFGQLAGDTEGKSIVHRIDNVSQAGFDFQVQVEEASKASTDAIEETTFYWAALDAAEDSFLFDAGTMATHHRYRDTGLSLEENEGFFADMQSLDGKDPGALRYHINSTGDLRLKIAEERSKDREKHHVDEETAFFTIDEGLYDFV